MKDEIIGRMIDYLSRAAPCWMKSGFPFGEWRFG